MQYSGRGKSIRNGHRIDRVEGGGLAIEFDRASVVEEIDSRRKHRLTKKNIVEFLELAKTLAETYEMANSSEKRQIVENAFSNRVVDGKKLELEPSNWLQEAETALSVLRGAPQCYSSRTRRELGQQVASALQALKCICSCQDNPDIVGPRPAIMLFNFGQLIEICQSDSHIKKISIPEQTSLG